MKTFEEATRLIDGPPSPETRQRIHDLYGRYKGIRVDVMTSEWAAQMVVNRIHQTIPVQALPQEVFDELCLIGVDMLFTGVVMGMEMEKP